MLTWSSWFADVGSESTECGCASALFSDASAAAVTCAIMKPELTPPSSTRNGGRPDRFESISSAMRRSDSAPISAIASARLSAANATGSAWKLPPERISPRLREHERIVGHRVRLDQQHAGRMPHLVDARAHHLRLAAQAVRVLHAVAVDVRRADVALREQVAVERRGVALAAMTAHRPGCADRTACRCRGTRRPSSRRRRTRRPARAPPRTVRRAPAPSTPACR